MRGSQVDALPNSPNQHHNNFIVDIIGKETDDV